MLIHIPIYYKVVNTISKNLNYLFMLCAQPHMLYGRKTGADGTLRPRATGQRMNVHSYNNQITVRQHVF